MPYNEKNRDYSLKYAKEKLKRVPLDMKKADYEQLTQVAAAVGLSVNGYIKQAIAEKIEREESRA